MRVDIEEIEAMRKRREQINATPIEDIEWYRNGKKMVYSEEQIEDWKFTWLGNIDFPRLQG